MDIMNNEKKVRRSYTYTSNGESKTVWCTTEEFIEIKRAYDDNGLTQLEEQYADLLDKLSTVTTNVQREINNIINIL